MGKGEQAIPGKPLTPFLARVERVIRAIPKGQVLAYGEVAALAGRPGGARAVARALHFLRDVPWWRVVRADRTFAPQVAKEQAKRLRKDGVAVKGARVIAR